MSTTSFIDAESWEVDHVFDMPEGAKFSWNRKARRFLYNRKKQIGDFIARHRRFITVVLLIAAAILAYALMYYAWLLVAIWLLANGWLFLYLVWYIIFVVAVCWAMIGVFSFFE